MYAIDAARKPPATIAVDCTITQAAQEMDRLAVGALVVVEPNGRPAGIVHRSRPGRPRRGPACRR
jgi:predicted transcriptional regulator